jgi:transcriptional regulator with XRE-family HTH domain
MKDKSLNEKVAFNIKKLRELEGLTPTQMADELKIARSTYGDIERATTDITLNKLEKIAHVLTTDVLNILDFEARNFYDIHHNHNGIVNHHHTVEEYALLKENNQLLKQEIVLLKEKLERLK